MSSQNSPTISEHLPDVIPSDWTAIRLDNLADFENGLWVGKKTPLKLAKVLRNTNFNNDGTLDLSDVAHLEVQGNHFEKRQLRYGDIILERSGGGPTQPVGRVVYFDLNDENFSFSNFTTRLRVLDLTTTEPKYLHYYLLHFYLQGHTNALQKRTTGIRNLMFAEYKAIAVLIPPLSEQCRIATVLNAIQEAIAAQEDVIAAARAFKRSLMQRLFTYGPGQQPAETKETEIGEIPVHWEVARLAEIAEIQSGGTPSRRQPVYYENGNISWVKTLDLTNNMVSSTEEQITQVALSSIRGKLRPRNTVMIAMYGGAGTIGKSGILGIEAATNQAVCCILPNPQRFDPFYLHYYVVQLRPRWMQYAIGTRKDPNISKTVIENQQVPLPPLNEQSNISEMLLAVDEKIAAEEDRKSALQAFFQCMLHQLMTGQTRLLSDEGLPL